MCVFGKLILISMILDVVRYNDDHEYCFLLANTFLEHEVLSLFHDEIQMEAEEFKIVCIA